MTRASIKTKIVIDNLQKPNNIAEEKIKTFRKKMFEFIEKQVTDSLMNRNLTTVPIRPPICQPVNLAAGERLFAKEINLNSSNEKLKFIDMGGNYKFNLFISDYISKEQIIRLPPRIETESPADSMELFANISEYMYPTFVMSQKTWDMLEQAIMGRTQSVLNDCMC
jgi:hypothetical protein